VTSTSWNHLIKEEPGRLVIVDVEHLRVEVPEVGWQRQFALDP